MLDVRRKPSVFISHSQADVAWRDRLVKHLRVVAEQTGFEVWDDSLIAAGDDWRAQIEQALSRARVAILLVSADFLTSSFIRDDTLPRLLERRRREGLRLVPVIVRPCPWESVAWLSALQVLPRDQKPLSSHDVDGSEDELSHVATEVDELLRRGPRELQPAEAVSEAPSSLAARERYLAFIAGRYRYLDFRGMGATDRLPLRLELREMYVPLAARVELPPGETWNREELRLAGRAWDAAEGERAGLSRPVPVEKLLQRHDVLVVLGDPGAGKTTLLKHLALCLARGEGQALGLGARLPVLVPLAAWAAALAVENVALVDFVADDLRARGVELPLRALLDEALAGGQALLLLDGLDEVRSAGERQLTASRLLDFFHAHRKAGNKFVLTSRIVGYREVRLVADGLGECTLVDFEDGEIEAFASRWTAAVERAAQGDALLAAREARRERDELLRSVHHNRGVRALAANPLLLTILALMKRQGVALPERRVELYQRYVETLLKHWNLARGLDRPPARDLDVVETLRVLAPLALFMHEASPGVGLVKRADVRAKLQEIYRARGAADPQVAARRLLEDLRTHAGLLLERGPGQYGFIHLTFQEYLAAIALAQQAQEGVLPLVQALRQRLGDGSWREASLLAIGYLGLVQQRDVAASAVVGHLLREATGEPGAAVVLCGEAVADAWPGGVTTQCRDDVRAALLATMRADGTAAPMRAAAGDALARVGDARFRAEAWSLPDEPLLGFVEIPAGPFLMGSDKGRDREAFDDELPQHEVTLPRYFIARFPVTVAQFRAFVEETALEVAYPHSLRGCLHAPASGVTWREAVAYTAWLTAKLRAWPGTPAALGSLLRAGTDGRPWRVTLPSEAEWEKAARGRDGRLYPWGDGVPDVRHANFDKAAIRRPSAVGCFPLGASPYGVEELSGNVWEWTRSLYIGYRYDAHDGREDLAAPENTHRAVRGGAFRNGASFLRAAVRSRFRSTGSSIGFRVVVSPF